MKHYRPRFPAWQPIREQVKNRGRKPSCHGHRHPTAILCSGCVWDDCKPPEPDEPGKDKP